MYPCYQNRIVPGTESFPVYQIIGENLLHLATWVVAGYLLWPIWTPAGLPLLTIFWAVLVPAVQILLKKHNCSGCYYYGKWCHLGWGKISSAMFRQDSGDPIIGKRLSLFYIVPPPAIFLASLVFAMLQSPALAYWSILGLFVFLNAVALPVRKKGCSVCSMREVCPGSAVKQPILTMTRSMRP